MVESVLSFLNQWAGSTWSILLDSAFLFLIGLTLAGILSLILNRRTVEKITSGHPVSAVFKAALVGLPLPLCSCSVLPVARELRTAGVSKGGVMAFLVSTPESGVDSVLLTYALTDPILTVARPVSAYLTALTAGLIETIWFDSKPQAVPEVESCGDDCSCEHDTLMTPKRNLLAQLWGGLKYAYTDIIADLAPYMLIGFALAGLVQAILVGSGMTLPASITSGWAGYVWALVIGIPLYVCATSSTPLAAVLLGAGFSPGAILVFLLAGPATNIAGIVMMRKIIGGWSTLRYLVCVAVVAILCGLALEWVYAATGTIPTYHQGEMRYVETNLLSTFSAIALSGLVAYHTGRKLLPRA